MLRTRPACALGAAAIALTTVSSCSSDTAQTVATSRAAHTEGQLVWTSDPHLWADVDRGAFDARRGEITAPTEHVAVLRLQAWVDRYDAAVRAIVRQEDARELVTPWPRVRLVIERDINASVSAVPTCITTSTAPEALPAGTSPMLLMRGRWNPSTGSETKCLESRSWSRASGLAWFNSLGGMRVRSDDAGFIVADDHRVSLRAAQVAITASAPFVNVNTGLVTRMSETGISVVIAHELAHYYRAHLTTSIEGKYDFWFDREEPVPERPTPVANQAEYRNDYLRLRLPRFLVTGQRYHARTATTLLRWVREMVPAPGHVCEPAVSTYEALPAGVRSELDPDAVGPLSAAAKEAYLEIERSLSPCIDTILLTSRPERDAAVPFSTAALPRAWFIRRIAPELRREMRGTAATTVLWLRELVALLEDVGRRLDDEASTFVKHLTENRIGLYTYEQEADEIAMELAARVGITPAQVIEGFTELMYAVEAPDRDAFAERYGMTADECAALMRSGFRVDGRPVYVPLGRLGDPHHAYCYRLFNLDREREVHAYLVEPATTPPPLPAWTEIQDAAEQLMDKESAPTSARP